MLKAVIEMLAGRMRYVDYPQTAPQAAPHRHLLESAARDWLSPNPRTNHTYSCYDVLDLAGSENTEATVRRFCLTLGEIGRPSAPKRLHRRVMFVEPDRPSFKERDEERVVSRERKKHWTTCISNGSKGFGIIGYCKGAANNTVRWTTVMHGV